VNDELFELYLANRLTPEDLARLKQVLAGDAQARTRFVQVLQEWQIFSEAARQITTGSTCSFEDELAQRAQVSADGWRRRRPAAPRPRRPIVRRVATVFAPLAALAACLAVVVMLAQPSARNEPFAVISAANAGVSLRRGELSVPVVLGTQLLPGDAVTVPAGVQAEIRYADDTRVAMAPRTTLVLAAAGNEAGAQGKRMTIAAGQVTASVSKQPPGQPMVFVTPTAQAVVLGTRLTLVVSPASTRLEVETGRVGLVRRSDRSRVEVATGQFAIAADGNELASRPLPRATVPAVADRRPNGLKAEYFDGPAFERLLFSRTEAGINADLGLETPAFDTHPANFTVRWTGQVEALHSETYLFTLRADSGVRLYVGERLLIDAWGDRHPKEHAVSVAMEAGKRYPLRVEYIQPSSGMLISLSWASLSQPQEIVPIESLTQP
jgi:hypothetical protein